MPLVASICTASTHPKGSRESGEGVSTAAPVAFVTMSTVPATTAPDFQGPVRELPRLEDAPGTTLELLVIATGLGYCAGVDLASGALVRVWSPEHPQESLHLYDTVKVTLDGSDDGVPDPADPEALWLTGAPELTGQLTGRRAERLLRPLMHPKGQPLLGIHAPAVRFWERSSDHPSIGLVEPEGPMMLRRNGDYLACRFGWRGTLIELPCIDRRLAALMDRARRTQMPGQRGDRLVVALHPPIDGHCHKVVEAVLPRP
jgi:hypothetical protein